MSETKVPKGKPENLIRTPKGVRYGGRQKGTPNKVTSEFRDTVRKLLEDNAGNVAEWLQRVAAEDPDKALQRLAQLAEYAAPKLSRAEVSGPGGAPIPTTIQIFGVEPNK